MHGTLPRGFFGHVDTISIRVTELIRVELSRYNATRVSYI